MSKRGLSKRGLRKRGHESRRTVETQVRFLASAVLMNSAC
jgi:hypothetical protein